MFKNIAVFCTLLLLASNCDGKHKHKHTSKSKECPKPRHVCPSEIDLLAIRGYSQLVPAHGYYKLHRYAETWDDAKKTCEHEGGHLAIINSDDEAKVLNQIIEKDGKSGWYHIGFEKGKDGQLKTIHGKPIKEAGFDKFAFDEPNGGAIENCGRYVKTSDGVYGLADEPCDYQAWFICEASLHHSHRKEASRHNSHKKEASHYLGSTLPPLIQIVF